MQDSHFYLNLDAIALSKIVDLPIRAEQLAPVEGMRAPELDEGCAAVEAQ